MLKQSYLLVIVLLFISFSTEASRFPSQSDFDFVKGKWHIITKERKSDGGFQEGKAIINAYSTKNEFGVEEDWQRIFPNSKEFEYWGTTFRVFDAKNQHWVSWWFDARDQNISPRFILKRNEDKITGFGTNVHPQFGERQFRVTFYDISEDSYKFQMDWSFDDGNTWITSIWSYEANRVKNP